MFVHRNVIIRFSCMQLELCMCAVFRCVSSTWSTPRVVANTQFFLHSFEIQRKIRIVFFGQRGTYLFKSRNTDNHCNKVRL